MSCSCRPNVHTQRELESLTRRKLRDPKFTWNDRFCNHIGRHLGVLKRDPYGKIQFCVLRVQVCQEEVAGGPPSLEAFRERKTSVLLARSVLERCDAADVHRLLVHALGPEGKPAETAFQNAHTQRG